ncbi:cartilage matrix protein-like [Mercenaria mercenaria]|uniref:cartilage matrix protein-like n=1 Tax=Mercenaria mercenaria TaxID=6596 RepID=UPI00234EA1FA|nr:cartilage matrix protein-like [Mercenaria mercenaria]
MPCGLAKTDLVFILDSSTSVTEENFVRMLQFCKDIINSADTDGGSVRVGAMTFGSVTEVQFNLNSFSKKHYLFDAIDEMTRVSGNSNVADAIRAARKRMFTLENGDRPDAENVIMLLTDGLSNINSQLTIPEAKFAHLQGIHIYAIGIGLSDTREIEGIASEPWQENSFSIRNFEELSDLSESLYMSECQGKHNVRLTWVLLNV